MFKDRRYCRHRVLPWIEVPSIWDKSSSPAASCDASSSSSSSSSERRSGWLFRRDDVLQRVRDIIVHLRRDHRTLVLKSIPPFLRLLAVVILQSLPVANVDFLHVFLQLLAQITDIVRHVDASAVRISVGLASLLVRVLDVLVSLIIRGLYLRVLFILIEIVIPTFISIASTKLYIFIFAV